MKKSKNPRELKILFENRGIRFKKGEERRDVHSINIIGYYKLKEFAAPYSRIVNGHLVYERLSFKYLISRYYQDKNLRVYILHALEDIEVFLNSKLADVLGNKKLGAFGYLEFKNWADRSGSVVLNPGSKNKKYLTKFEMEKQQYIFKKNILNQMKHSHLPDMNREENLNDDGFPSVWTMVDCLTFGNTVHLITMMNPSNKRKMANLFKCNLNELISWIRFLNLIRNICVHNSDLIDFKVRTPPKVPDKYKELLLSVELSNKEKYDSNLAIIISIIKLLMDHINDVYRFGDIKDSLQKLIKDDIEIAHTLGFQDEYSYRKLLPKNNVKGKKRKRNHSKSNKRNNNKPFSKK